ncbi:hypothetical protein [Nonomuraea sp. WAC 01424]|uniref:hypothetical protein n=1 Tax=Nonomuraea sp. WAC 01424 TaxID=2203200 RepID=UPI00163C2EEC|nr:hypothetical protein [Nonomuraea sp. WAC 01424]
MTEALREIWRLLVGLVLLVWFVLRNLPRLIRAIWRLGCAVARGCYVAGVVAGAAYAVVVDVATHVYSWGLVRWAMLDEVVSATRRPAVEAAADVDQEENEPAEVPRPRPAAALLAAERTRALS